MKAIRYWVSVIILSIFISAVTEYVKRGCSTSIAGNIFVLDCEVTE